MAETWKPDPTGRCELRLEKDGEWTDHVSQGGVALIDPWEMALKDVRPMGPWIGGEQVCGQCGRGVCRSESRCPCGGFPTTARAPSDIRRESEAVRRTRRIVLGVCGVVLGGAAVAVIYRAATYDPCPELVRGITNMQQALLHPQPDVPPIATRYLANKLEADVAEARRKGCTIPDIS